MDEGEHADKSSGRNKTEGGGHEEVDRGGRDGWVRWGHETLRPLKEK